MDDALTNADRFTKNESCCPSLSLKVRLIGFIILWVLSILFGILAGVAIFGLLKSGDISKFIIFNCISTFCSISSSFFLRGPVAQFKVVTDKKRIIPSLIFLLAFILSIVFAKVLDGSLRNVLCLLCLLIQNVAGFFYFLTFIPFGNKICFKCCKSCMSCDDD
jgi:hypothetical protein